MPRRVQLRRTPGWRMPANTVKVDRSTKWGNPFVPGEPSPDDPDVRVRDRAHAVALYRASTSRNPTLVAAARADLRGKNLACWCPLPEPGEPDHCHAAVLLEIANG